MNRRAQLICIACGPVFTLLFAIGGALVGRLIPPFLDPADPAEEFVRKVVDHLVRVRVGAFIMMMSVCFMAPWGASMAAQTRSREGAFPVLSYAQLACVGAGTAIAMMMSFFWAIMAFRPQEYAPTVVQYSADLAYYMPLFSWPIFSLWCVAIALAVLLDDTGEPVYPRWTGWFNLWCALLYVPGGLILYFKRGPFAWDGLIALYVPFVAFFIWINVMAVVCWRKLRALPLESRHAPVAQLDRASAF